MLTFAEQTKEFACPEIEDMPLSLQLRHQGTSNGKCTVSYQDTDRPIIIQIIDSSASYDSGWHHLVTPGIVPGWSMSGSASTCKALQHTLAMSLNKLDIKCTTCAHLYDNLLVRRITDNACSR